MPSKLKQRRLMADLADARHQAKYVSAIWQKLIPATSTND